MLTKSSANKESNYTIAEILGSASENDWQEEAISMMNFLYRKSQLDKNLEMEMAVALNIGQFYYNIRYTTESIKYYDFYIGNYNKQTDKNRDVFPLYPNVLCEQAQNYLLLGNTEEAEYLLSLIEAKHLANENSAYD